MRKYCLQGAIGWLVAGAVVSAVFSIEVGPVAWWVMAVVSPYVIAYFIGAIVNWNEVD